MIQVVNEYVTFISQIKDQIHESPYKTSYFYEALDMTKQTFYRKLRSQTFAPDEVLILSKILYPAEALRIELQNSSVDKDQGKIIDHEEAMSLIRQRYAS